MTNLICLNLTGLHWGGIVFKSIDCGVLSTVSSQHYDSRFWVRWLLIGALAGALAGAIVAILILILFAGAAPWLKPGYTPIMAILGGVYGIGQGTAQFLSLRSYIPPMRRSLRTNFIGTAVGSAVTGILLVVLLAIGFVELLIVSGFSPTLIWILGAFIVGGFGGIAQAIVERALLGTTVRGSYFRWIAPLALLGHVSGAIAGFVTALFLQEFLQNFWG